MPGEFDVAALYIDPRGPYPKMPGVDCYDEERNAEMYAGPWPVVAHPPCGPWGRLRHLSTNDAPEHALHAIAIVREFGGVLEHPRGSLLWKALDLPAPGESDAFGFTIEVAQVEWGHVARKVTWLYLVGVPWSAIERPPFPGREPTHWVTSFRSTTSDTPKRYKQNGSAVPVGIKVCSAQQRRRTPPLFAEYLVRLARSARAR